MKPNSILPFSLALAFLLLSVLNLLGMNGIFGVFVGGVAFAHHITKKEEIKERKVQESMARIFTIPVFLLFGTMLPWQEWSSLGWTAVAGVVLVLLLRRIPGLLTIMPLLPKFKGKFSQVLVMGWFGPIGVAALYYACLSLEKTDFQQAWILPSLLVFSSTLVHGMTSVPFESWYHNKYGKGS
jgi:NhaP-type Na+/H+ or K+/H+ antiporter